MTSKVRLLTTRRKWHLSDQVIFDLRDELIGNKLCNGRKDSPFLLPDFVPFRIRCAIQHGILLRESQFIVAMNIGQLKDAGHPEILARCKRRILYLFDAWPEHLDRIVSEVKAYRITDLLVSDRSAANKLQNLVPEINVEWVPEAISPSFCSDPDVKKEVDIVSFGRSHGGLGKQLVDELTPRGYEVRCRIGDEPLEPDEASFRDLLRKSKTVLCFPLTSTHPLGETWEPKVTQRYFQAFASGSLVVGESCPALVEIFGYDPVVSLDYSNPVSCLCRILDNYEKYRELVSKNREETLINHSWSKRFQWWLS